MMNRRTFGLTASAFAVAGTAAADNLSDELTLGAPSARLHLIEYSSMTCPHCAAFHAANWARLKSGYIDTGRLRFTLREMATPPASVALGMFQLARCGEADALEYFRRVAILFERQGAILGAGTMLGVRDSLIALGGEWGLTSAQVMASLSDRRGGERLTRSIEEATRRGVTGTPAFFIGEERVSDPAMFNAEGLSGILDTRLAAARGN